jgi:hypothetical protein
LGEFCVFTLNCEENFGWGNFIWSFLRVLLGVPRSSCEEGGQLVFRRVFLGILLELLSYYVIGGTWSVREERGILREG